MELATLQKDMVAAMKARDKATKDAISSVISAVKKVGPSTKDAAMISKAIWLTA